MHYRRLEQTAPRVCIGYLISVVVVVVVDGYAADAGKRRVFTPFESRERGRVCVDVASPPPPPFPQRRRENAEHSLTGPIRLRLVIGKNRGLARGGGLRTCDHRDARRSAKSGGELVARVSEILTDFGILAEFAAYSVRKWSVHIEAG